MKGIGLCAIGLCGVLGASPACGAAPSSDVPSGAATVSGDEGAVMAVTRPKVVPFEGVVKETELDSNLAAKNQRRPMQDPDLINAWGLAFASDGFVWIAANGTGTDRKYDEDGNFVRSIGIPTPDGRVDPTAPSAPTGQVRNPFPTEFKHDAFVMVTEDGTVIGVQPNDMAQKNIKDNQEAFVRADNSNPNKHHVRPAVYKGVAIATFHGEPRVFATDFSNGKIDVFEDEHYGFVKSFTDPNLPDRFAPFNVLAVSGEQLIVTFAFQDDAAHDDVAAPGNGFVDICDTSGDHCRRLLSGDQHPELNSPWGLALSPEHGDGDVDLLVGNFGNGDNNQDTNPQINVYALSLRAKAILAFEGPLGVVKNNVTQPLVISGMWSIAFGSGKGHFDVNDLYFAAGPDNGPGTDPEGNGLFGELDFVSARR
jgi:uncharacterized protein (TIGR03118 family)